MDEDKTLNFCTECGANIHQYDEFCPACGYRLKGNNTSYTADPRFKAETVKKLNVVIITGAIWAVLAILNTVYGIITIDSSIDYVIEMLKGDPYNYTDSEIEPVIEFMRTFVMVISGILITSGALAIISIVLCSLRRFNSVAYWACILGSILALIAIVPGIIGLVLSGRIKAAKSEFKD
jgi:hypothetical protein